MRNQAITAFVPLPADEARVRWERAGSVLKQLVLPDEQDYALHFIPAEGGCVIAAIPLPKTARPLNLGLQPAWSRITQLVRRRHAGLEMIFSLEDSVA